MNLNMISISAIQFILILLPTTVNVYLIKTVSFELYGKFIFFLSLFNFLSILINSGLANDSLRDLSRAFDNYIVDGSKEFDTRMNEYIGIKLFYLSISFILCFFLSFINIFHDRLFYCLFVYLIYFSLDFLIFYQVINKLATYMCISLVSFISSVILLFFFIHQDADIYYVSFLVTLPFIILNMSLLIFNLIRLKFRLNFSADTIKTKVKNNYKLMFSNISSAVVSKGVYLFIGTVLGVGEVAVYSVLDQICRAPLIFINRLSSLYTPRIVNAISQNNYTLVKTIFSNIFIKILTLALATCFILSSVSHIILPFFIKDGYMDFGRIMPLFIIMLSIIPSISLSSLCAMQYYLNLKNDMIIYKYSILLLLFGMPFIFLSASLYKLFGLALSYAIVEAFVLIYFLWFLDFNPLRTFYL